MITKWLLILMLLLFLPALRTAVYADSNEQPGKTLQKNKNKENSEVVPFISISTNKKKANVGDLIDLTIKYTLPEGSSFDETGFNETDFEGIEGLTIISRKSEKGEIKLTILNDKIRAFHRVAASQQAPPELVDCHVGHAVKTQICLERGFVMIIAFHHEAAW